LLRTLKDRQFIAMTLEDLARTLRFLDQREEALRLAEESLALRREIGNRYGIASSLLVLDESYMWLGCTPPKSGLTEEAISIFTQLGDREGLCRAYCSLSLKQIAVGEYEQAASVMTTAIKFADELEYKRWQGRCRWIAGLVLLGRGDHLQAHTFLRESIAVLEAVGIPYEVGWAYGTYAYSAWKLGNFPIARNYVALALRIALRHRDLSVARQALLSAALLTMPHNPERAVELFTLAWQEPLSANSQLGHDLWERDFAALLAATPVEQAALPQRSAQSLDLFEEVAQVLRELEPAPPNIKE
jgi:tetratricopeptide (TPR) repeat protein